MNSEPRAVHILGGEAQRLRQSTGSEHRLVRRLGRHRVELLELLLLEVLALLVSHGGELVEGVVHAERARLLAARAVEGQSAHSLLVLHALSGALAPQLLLLHLPHLLVLGRGHFFADGADECHGCAVRRV